MHNSLAHGEGLATCQQSDWHLGSSQQVLVSPTPVPQTPGILLEKVLCKDRPQFVLNLGLVWKSYSCTWA